MLFEDATLHDPIATALNTSLGDGVHELSVVGQQRYSVFANPGSLSIEMATLTGLSDVNMILYDSANRVVASDFQGSSVPERIDFQVTSSGIYTIELFQTAPQGDATRVRLAIDAPDETWSRVLPFGPIRDVSVSLFDIDNDGEQEIFVGTSKGLDAQGREVRPAGFVCLEADGTVKWQVSFPAIAGPDSQTGHVYQTTSVSTEPVFADLNGDGRMEIVVGVGADSTNELGQPVVGQPGDRGGVYALDSNGNIVWFHQSRDTIGGADNRGDGRPDGVYGAPVVFDIDRDGVREVIYNSWDQSTWILDGRTGTPEVEVHLADTIWSTPHIADITGDNVFEILVSADITENADARTRTGGIFHVISANGDQNTPGFDQPVGNPEYTTLRGKFEEQVLWSSPVTADLDGDGFLEIVYGTGNYLQDDRGTYIRVWEHDGTSKFLLDTGGRTFATPLIADLDANGDLEIVAATLTGGLYAWHHTGELYWQTYPATFPGTTGAPIFSSPVAVDLNGDRTLEILVSIGSQTVIIGHDGRQISDAGTRTGIFETFKGSPAVRDIDADGRLEIISGGTTAARDQAVVYRFENPFDVQIGDFVAGRYQEHQSQSNIEAFVERFYVSSLGRGSDAAGLNYWVESLASGILAGGDVGRAFFNSAEFLANGLTNEQFVDVLYRAFFDRDGGADGRNAWVPQLNSGTDRNTVMDGFIRSEEFRRLSAGFRINPS
ncbi:FG-GAP-like repeat-containing protein [Salinarimonas ramus]|uniref:DUF4214 domain-containing protein n=1 Tax=Salinarimonas ramus TaxID=690164 RepID=A0A917QE47_9HYPH|nr:FG-GAP-like repeat-containing protein [Salinarimonas ramus]GGK47076.1 hypothetical protein GCM10011322_37670 [Salinarimonas ramus]